MHTWLLNNYLTKMLGTTGLFQKEVLCVLWEQATCQVLTTICRSVGYRQMTHNSPSHRRGHFEGHVYFVVLKVTSLVLENQKFLQSPFPWLAPSLQVVLHPLFLQKHSGLGGNCVYAPIITCVSLRKILSYIDLNYIDLTSFPSVWSPFTQCLRLKHYLSSECE